ncbi:MAG: DinB family protein [Pyrinomonadaceae bacterium]|nr:DinB family protein [Sphingobacteriaceae bacterium]
MKRPQPDEYGSFHKTYIDLAPDDVLTELENQLNDFPEFMSSIPQHKHEFAYAEGKWTLKELLGHMLDTERIMTYRLLRFSRNDSTALQGFEEDEYVLNSTYRHRKFAELVDEFKAVRFANLFLFKSLSDEQLNRRGTASNLPVSVRVLLFIIAGHLNHHKRIIQERYL